MNHYEESDDTLPFSCVQIKIKYKYFLLMIRDPLKNLSDYDSEKNFNMQVQSRTKHYFHARAPLSSPIRKEQAARCLCVCKT